MAAAMVTAMPMIIITIYDHLAHGHAHDGHRRHHH
jgi:hypothetical protein